MKCYFDNQCNINVNNRHACSSCRLKKCFTSGMCIEMIRSTLSENKSTIDSTSTAFVIQDNKNQSEQVTYASNVHQLVNFLH